MYYCNFCFVAGILWSSSWSITAQCPGRFKVAYWISSNSSFIQYCDSNIRLFSIAPPLVIALPTLRQQKLLHLIPLLKFCINFVDQFMAYFLYCFPYSYRSSNYCDSNSCRCFTFLKAIAKRKGTIIAFFALKGDIDMCTFTLRYRL